METEQLDATVKRKKKRKKYIIACAATGVLLVVVAGVFLAKRYMPTEQKMSGYDYFGRTDDETPLVLLNEEQIANIGRFDNDEIYVKQSFVEDSLNLRFYYDKETNAVLYADSEEIYTFYPDIKGYKGENGQTFDTKEAIVKMIDGELYMNFAFVAERSNIRYTYAQRPARLVIYTDFEETNYVDAIRTAHVRYRAGIKSKVLEKVSKDTPLKYEEEVDEEWICVYTESGYKGYVRKAEVSDVYAQIPQDTYKETYASHLLDHHVNLVWFQVTQKAANANLANYMQAVTGVNVVSPTWYSISDVNGNLTSLATQSLVDDLHAKGIQVWPLVDDFNKNLDFEELYTSKRARTTLINNLMQEAKQYGYDGYNIDFEYIKKGFADDYLQFLRELSMACNKNNIILSVDNYKPASHNAQYRLEEQAVFVDYIIIMGYDEHYAGSDAGSVASLPFVEDGLSKATAMVPSKQIINAVPFYTRIWTENDGKTTSRAVGMQTALDTMTQNNAVAVWDETAGQYYCSYETADGTVKIWLEEERSLGEKMKLYAKYNLGGVAGWKLNLQMDTVWNVLSDGLQY